jgi:hypothetical protein
MGDTMPKQGQSGQHEVGEEAQMPLPPWVGAVKIAVMIMSALIVIGLALLVYGLATGINKKTADGGAVTLHYPAGATLVSVSAGAEGTSLLLFRMADGSEQIIIMAPGNERILGRINLEEAADFGVAPR